MMRLSVFVDGVGGRRELHTDGRPHWHFAVPPPRMSAAYARSTAAPSHLDAQKATFERIGELRDGRLVYGQVEAKLALWHFKNSIVPQQVPPVPMEMLLQMEQRALESFTAQMAAPIVVLSDTVEHAHQLRVRRVEGVGRKRA